MCTHNICIQLQVLGCLFILPPPTKPPLAPTFGFISRPSNYYRENIHRLARHPPRRRHKKAKTRGTGESNMAWALKCAPHQSSMLLWFFKSRPRPPIRRIHLCLIGKLLSSTIWFLLSRITFRSIKHFDNYCQLFNQNSITNKVVKYSQLSDGNLVNRKSDHVIISFN